MTGLPDYRIKVAIYPGLYGGKNRYIKLIFLVLLVPDFDGKERRPTLIGPDQLYLL